MKYHLQAIWMLTKVIAVLVLFSTFLWLSPFWTIAVILGVIFTLGAVVVYLELVAEYRNKDILSKYNDNYYKDEQ